MSSGAVLIVEDDRDMAYTLKEKLLSMDMEVSVAGTIADASRLIGQVAVDAVLLDHRLPDGAGLDFIPTVLGMDPSMPVIMMTAYSLPSLGAQAISRGAFDYFTKPFPLSEMQVVLNRAISRRRLMLSGHDATSNHDAADMFIGSSVAMARVRQAISKVKDLNITVLIDGETGTGKDMAARMIHQCGRRSSAPFVKVNCASVPESLFESEFFGYMKGAFTGAVSDRDGYFQQAHGGTLFLDEIGELPVAMQGKLLQAVQERAVRRVGGRKIEPVDVRIIAATNISLESAVARGLFRKDLYYRINIVRIVMPPLRERKDDIDALAIHFQRRINAETGVQARLLDNDMLERLKAYNWPGNVRELEHFITRWMVMGHEDMVTEGDADILYGMELYDDFKGDSPASLLEELKEVERRSIVAALRRCGGVQAKAARELGLTERSLWYRIKKLKIRVNDPSS
jgi:two-component system NtrC family response regulator